MSDWKDDGPRIGWAGELQGESIAYCWGAAVAFGLMGMAEAIRTRGLCRHGKERCWECFHPDE